MLDLAAPGASRPDPRTALDLVRSGWLMRWRSRPPVWRWLLYRGFDRRLPQRYHGWVADDIDGLLFPLRQGIGGLAIAVFVWVVSVPGLPREMLWGVPVYVALSVLLRRRTWKQAVDRHLVPSLDIEPSPWISAWQVGSRPRRRLLAGRWVTATGLGLLGSAAATLPVAAWAPTSFTVAGLPITQPDLEEDVVLRSTAVALLIGLAAAAVVGRASGRLAARPPQPHRTLVDGHVGLALACTLTPGACLAGLGMILAASAAWLVALVAAVAAPGLVVAGLVSGRRAGKGAPVAVVDVGRAVLGRDWLCTDPPVVLWSNPYEVTSPSERWTPGRGEGPTPVA